MDFRNSPLLRRLIFSSGLRFVGMGVAILAGLYLTPFLFERLGANDCGLLVFVNTIVKFITMLELGLCNATSRHIAAAIGEKNTPRLLRFYNSGFFLYLCVGLSVIVISTLVSIYLYDFIEFVQKTLAFFGPGFVPDSFRNFGTTDQFQRNIFLTRILMVLVSIQFAVGICIRVYESLISGSLRTEITAAIQLGIQIVRPILSIIILVFFPDIISVVFGGFCLTLALVPVWYLTARTIVPDIRFSASSINWDTIKTLYKFSIFAFLAQSSAHLHLSISILVLTAFSGLEAVAIYSYVAFTLYTYGKDVVLNMTSYLSPVFAHLSVQKESESMRKTLFFAVKVATGASIFIVFGLIAWGQPFIERWMGPDKPEMLLAFPPLVILAIALLLEQSQSPTVEYLYGTATHRYYAFVNMIEAMIAILLFPMLVFYYGMTGIALGLLSANVVSRGILQPHFVCKVLKIPKWHYYALFLRLFFVGAICVVLPSIVTFLLVDKTFPRLFLVGGLSLVLYLPPYILFAFSKEEKDLVWHAVFRRKS